MPFLYFKFLSYEHRLIALIEALLAPALNHFRMKLGNLNRNVDLKCKKESLRSPLKI